MGSKESSISTVHKLFHTQQAKEALCCITSGFSFIRWRRPLFLYSPQISSIGPNPSKDFIGFHLSCFCLQSPCVSTEKCGPTYPSLLLPPNEYLVFTSLLSLPPPLPSPPLPYTKSTLSQHSDLRP